MPFEGGIIDRGSALQLMYDIDDPKRRKAVFDSFHPLWAALNGNNEPDSPYRRVIKLAAEDGKGSGTYVEQAARAIGVTTADVERWLIEMLDAWRLANGPEQIEPWDFRYSVGEANRLLAARIPPDALVPLNQRFYVDLGANLEELGVVYDLAERVDKSPLAYCDFLRARPLRGGRQLAADHGAHRRHLSLWRPVLAERAGARERPRRAHQRDPQPAGVHRLAGHAIHRGFRRRAVVERVRGGLAAEIPRHHHRREDLAARACSAT